VQFSVLAEQVVEAELGRRNVPNPHVSCTKRSGLVR
jgi:hypothetical protein